MLKKDLNNTFYLYYRFYPYLKPYLLKAFLSIIITIPVGALDAVIAYSLRPYMDIVMLKQNISSAWIVPIAIIAFTAVQGIFRFTSIYLNGWVGYNVGLDLKRDLFNKLLTIETSYFTNSTSGNVISRFSTDVDLASSTIIDNTNKFLIRFFTSIFLIGVLIYNSWQLAVVAVFVPLFMFLPLTFIKKKVKRYSQAMLQGNSILLNAYNEAFSGNKIIASYNLCGYLFEKFKKSLKTIFKFNMKMTILSGWLSPVMHFVASFGIAFVIWYGSSLIISNTITMGAFVSFITALLMLYNPLKGLGNTMVSIQSSLVALGRITELFDYQPKIASNPDAINITGINQDISLNNIYFEYEEGIPVINGINLKIKKGETIAFVGNSGGGKTTIVNLIPRFYDVKSGTICIDGVDVKDIDLKSLRNNIAVVFQDNFLFEGSIKENILMGKFDATEEELQQAVSDAYLDEFGSELTDGLKTQIGERGVLLSGGQKQRIAIARALLKDAPIVVLDEATSALDNKSESLIQQALEKLMDNKTVIVIAHRLSTIKNVDRIAVIDQGRIVELGTHQELINKDRGFYQNLYYLQFENTVSV